MSKVQTVYDTGNTLLPGNDIQSIRHDGAGGLWIGTSQGLARRSADGSWEVFKANNSGLPNDDVKSLFVDSNGGVWAGTAAGLAHRAPDGSWTTFNTADSGLPYDGVSALIGDAKGLWIGTGAYFSAAGGGLARLTTDGSWSVYPSDNGVLPENEVNAVHAAPDGSLWAGTDGGGLACRAPTGAWTVYAADNSGLPGDFITAVYADGNGLWAGTAHNGLARFSGSAWTVYNAANSGLPHNNVNALAPDNSGGLWIGTGDSFGSGGLAHFSASGDWTVYHAGREWNSDTQQYDIRDLPSNNVLSFAGDGAGGVWAGTEGGLAHYSADGVWQVWNQSNNGLPDDRVRALLVDTGGVWAGTANGLAYFDAAGNWEIFNVSNDSLPDNQVNALYTDADGDLWAGTGGALSANGGLAYRSPDNTWQVFTPGNSGLPGRQIRALFATDAYLWTGTSGGLAQLNFTRKTALVQRLLAKGNDSAANELLNHRRAALLIHPRGHNQATLDFMAGYVYRSLHERAYDHDEIFYLAYRSDLDFNADRQADGVADGPVTLAEFRAGIPYRDLTAADVAAAFAWATKRGPLDMPLTVIVTGDGISGKLWLDPEYKEFLDAAGLDALLDNYQAATGNKVILIIDAPYSGALLPGLAGEKRLVISSTGDNPAYYQDLGRISFLKFFFDRLRLGWSFLEALTGVITEQGEYLTGVTAAQDKYRWPFSEKGDATL
ncbi:MAG: hypothetical protein GY862_00690, partial [Gammaproteobacteria bacterium]|nr:hypothetical protein [Gammaproteobacteria bacterium]